MVINTHLLLSRIICNYCLKELNFKLHKGKFMYGNIIPDINTNEFSTLHTLDETVSIVSEYSYQLINDEMSIEQFSLILGIICHFICDYFCLYHQERYKDKNIFKHIVYEILLHVVFLILVITGKLRSIRKEILQIKDIQLSILFMHEAYQHEDKSMLNDITYAVSTAMGVAELIICLSNVKYKYAEKLLNVREGA